MTIDRTKSDRGPSRSSAGWFLALVAALFGLVGCAAAPAAGPPTAPMTTGTTPAPSRPTDPDTVLVELDYTVYTVAGSHGSSSATLFGDGTVRRTDAGGATSTVTLSDADLAAVHESLDVLADAGEPRSHISDSPRISFAIHRDGATIVVVVDDWPASMVDSLPGSDRARVEAAQQVRTALLRGVTTVTKTP